MALTGTIVGRSICLDGPTEWRDGTRVRIAVETIQAPPLTTEERVGLATAWEGAEPPWLRPSIEVLTQLLALPTDWDSYGSRQIAPAAVDLALSVLRDVMPDAAPPPQIVPMSAGGVQLEWHEGGIDVEVTIRPSGEVMVLFEDLTTGHEWEGELPARRADLTAALDTLTDRI